MQLDYETPPPDPLARRKRGWRITAVTLLIGGLLFGIAETTVFVLGMLAVGPFDDMRREGLAARAGEMILVLAVGVGGFGLAIIGYFLDPSRERKRPHHTDRN
jgi:hypothetical protein